MAAIVDVRGGKLFADVQAALESLRDNASVRVVFLDATDAALVRRFEQVRRPHPLQGDGTLLDGITEERTRMAELRSQQSDLVIDTSRPQHPPTGDRRSASSSRKTETPPAWVPW